MPIKKKSTNKKAKTTHRQAHIGRGDKFDLTEPILAITDALDYHSKHTINLRELAPVTPPAVRPAKNQDRGVNLSIRQNAFGQLSIVKLGVPVAWLFKKLVAFQTAHFNEGEVEDIFSPPPYKRFFGLKISKRWHRSIALFLLVALVLIIPLQLFSYYHYLTSTKNKVVVLSQDAINYLQLGKDSALRLDLELAASQFTQAKENFSLARRQIDDINWLSAELIKYIPYLHQSVSAGDNLLMAGETFSHVGERLSRLGDQFISEGGTDYYTSLVQLNTELADIITEFEVGKQALEKVQAKNLPAQYQQTFTDVIESLPTLENRLHDLSLLTDTLLTILGRDQWQRYLLVFTNNNEMRGVGGFMGSFAVLDIDQGQIKRLDVPAGGTYDIQGQLVPKVIAPEPLHLINARWEFQDANWWPSFPITARKIQWFYKNAGGPSTDGVVLMTAEMMSRLLNVLGPITVAGYDTAVSGDNFVGMTQEIIREQRDQASAAPKQFLADLAPQVLERLFAANGDDLKKILAVLQQGLAEKQLLLYFNNPDIQQVVGTLDWAGQIRETSGDYLSVIHTNLAGGKTDEVIDQVISHQADIQADGSIIDTVTIARTHNGIPGKDIFTGVQNNSYVRFYVPAGSVLLKAEGFKKPDNKYFDTVTDDLQPDEDLLTNETNHQFDQSSGTDIYQESGKTVFGNWLQLPAGQQQTATIQYRLPFTIAPEGENAFYYSLLTQKQSGSLNTELHTDVHFAPIYDVVGTFPAALDRHNDVISGRSLLTTDQFYGLVLTKQ